MQLVQFHGLSFDVTYMFIRNAVRDGHLQRMECESARQPEKPLTLFTYMLNVHNVVNMRLHVSHKFSEENASFLIRCHYQIVLDFLGHGIPSGRHVRFGHGRKNIVKKQKQRIAHHFAKSCRLQTSKDFLYFEQLGRHQIKGGFRHFTSLCGDNALPPEQTPWFRFNAE